MTKEQALRTLLKQLISRADTARRGGFIEIAERLERRRNVVSCLIADLHHRQEEELRKIGDSYQLSIFAPDRREY